MAAKRPTAFDKHKKRRAVSPHAAGGVWAPVSPQCPEVEDEDEDRFKDMPLFYKSMLDNGEWRMMFLVHEMGWKTEQHFLEQPGKLCPLNDKDCCVLLCKGSFWGHFPANLY